jgi:putative heme-binding domain-containing protein
VDALKAGQVNVVNLGPANAYRLRHHADDAVARRANAVIDELRGPEVKEKNALLAKLTPEVDRPGDLVRGKALFTQNCAVCHKLNGEGKDVGPELTGMGAHGPAELLVSVLDPNREVDPSFVAWSIETKDGETYDGVIASENRASVTLRNNSGENIIKVSDIKTRRNTGRSQMPEGFEALGGEGLRDILAYVCGADAKYRFIDLRGAFTADSTKGIYSTQESVRESLEFKKFGLVKAGDVPFEIISPNKTSTGKNLVVLKGGSGFARTLPQKVEISGVNLKATRLHFLGGVGGWAWPFGGDANRGLPAAKITVSHSDGQNEEFTLQNGVEIADYNGTADVPGSKPAADLVTHGQVRTFSRALQGRAPIQKITLESFNNAVAATFVSITAELGEGGTQVADAAAGTPDVRPAPPANFKWGRGLKTLIVGGGSSHDFNKWFNLADTATLQADGMASVNYTDRPGDMSATLKDIDVLCQTSNQSMKDPGLRKAIFEFADAGKGLLLIHPGLWYNWPDWPDYNRVLCGGGARSHNAYGEFEVKLTGAKHPIVVGVPASFKISDELYHFEHDPKGSPIQVLATAYDEKSGKTYPMVWIVQHPKARIVAIALGHDGKAHEHPAYKTMLRNALAWAAGK